MTKTMKHRVLSLILALCAIVTLFSGLATEANAAEAVTKATVEERLRNAESKWPNGCVYVDAWSDGCGTCFGFARELFRYVFNTNMPTCWVIGSARFTTSTNLNEIGHAENYSTATLKGILAKGMPGDVLVISNGKTNHAMILRSVKNAGEGVYVYDANWNKDSSGRPLIRSNAYMSASSIQSSRSRGVTLYRYSNYSSTTSNTASTLTIGSDFKGPTGTITSSFGLRGTITSNYNITRVYAYVKNTETGQIPSGFSYTKTGSMTSYDIQYGGLNSAFSFSNLANGSYQYYVEATDSSGKTVSRTTTFTKGTVSTPAASTLAIGSDFKGPTGTLTSSFGLRGTITSNYKITRVYAYVKNTSTGQIPSGFSYTKTGSMSSYDIQYGGLNNAFKFSSLPKGTYMYYVQATDSSGKTVSRSTTFTKK